MKMELRGKTLVVEDEPTSRHILKKILEERGHSVTAVSSAEEGWQLFQQEMFTLVVIDWLLSGMSGIDLCERIRAREKSRFTTVLMITSKDQSEDLHLALEAGADDYLTKPVTPKVLNLRFAVIENHLKMRIERELSEENRKEAEMELQRRSTIDPVTQVPGRVYILQTANQEISRSKRYGSPLAALLINIADMHTINDIRGSKNGDLMLQEFATRCRSTLRKCDHVGRIGGNSFLILFPETDLKGACAATERLRQSLLEKTYTPEEITIKLHLSQTQLLPEDMHFDQLLKRCEKEIQQKKLPPNT